MVTYVGEYDYLSKSTSEAINRQGNLGKNGMISLTPSDTHPHFFMKFVRETAAETFPAPRKWEPSWRLFEQTYWFVTPFFKQQLQQESIDYLSMWVIQTHSIQLLRRLLTVRATWGRME
jgi:hypothetical protein